MAGGGVFLLYPELSTPDVLPVSEAATEEASPGAAITATPPTAGGILPTATSAALSASGEMSDWKTIAFVIPGSGLWLEQDGHFTATGSLDTIAWSEDLFGGDLEISFDVESSSSYSSATIIVYGNGGSLAPGNLIFMLASDLQAIQADTIYQGGKYLYSSMSSLVYGDQKHSGLISINDRVANLFVNGEKIATAKLDGSINTSGKVGLFKWGGVDNVTFSNILVRSMEPGG